VQFCVCHDIPNSIFFFFNLATVHKCGNILTQLYYLIGLY